MGGETTAREGNPALIRFGKMSVEQVSHASGRRQPNMKLSGRKYFISLNVQYKCIQNPDLQWSGTKSTLV